LEVQVKIVLETILKGPNLLLVVTKGNELFWEEVPKWNLIPSLYNKNHWTIGNSLSPFSFLLILFLCIKKVTKCNVNVIQT